MEEIEQYGNQYLLARRHQGFELERDEAAGKQGVVIGVEKASERTGHLRAPERKSLTEAAG
jgi:hypothetical protein